MRLVFTLLLLILAAGSAWARDMVRVPVPVPLAEGADIDPEILGDCMVQRNFTDALVRELRKVAVPAPSPLTDMKGQVLKVEIVDAMWGGNWAIGHVQGVRVRGALYQDGERQAGFQGVMHIAGGEMTSGCFQINAKFRALTWHIKRWLADPVDGARIGQGQ